MNTARPKKKLPPGFNLANSSLLLNNYYMGDYLLAGNKLLTPIDAISSFSFFKATVERHILWPWESLFEKDQITGMH